MGLHNFHPKNALLLDGYHFVRKVAPFVDLFDADAAENVLNEILGQVQFTPWNEDNKTTRRGFWLGLVKLEGVSYAPIFEKLDGNRNIRFAPTLLTPSGFLLRASRKTGVIGSFHFEGNNYVEFDDGTFIQVTPSLDTRFLTSYKEQESQAVSEPEKKIVENKKTSMLVDENGRVVEIHGKNYTVYGTEDEITEFIMSKVNSLKAGGNI